MSDHSHTDTTAVDHTPTDTDTSSVAVAVPGRQPQPKSPVAGKKTKWTILNIIVVVYALTPVLWILSLSFKTTDTLTDGSFIPLSWTFQNYIDIFQTTDFLR